MFTCAHLRPRPPCLWLYFQYLEWCLTHMADSKYTILNKCGGEGLDFQNIVLQKHSNLKFCENDLQLVCCCGFRCQYLVHPMRLLPKMWESNCLWETNHKLANSRSKWRCAVSSQDVALQKEWDLPKKGLRSLGSKEDGQPERQMAETVSWAKVIETTHPPSHGSIL